jgi:hypothetical protein
VLRQSSPSARLPLHHSSPSSPLAVGTSCHNRVFCGTAGRENLFKLEFKLNSLQPASSLHPRLRTLGRPHFPCCICSPNPLVLADSTTRSAPYAHTTINTRASFFVSSAAQRSASSAAPFKMPVSPWLCWKIAQMLKLTLLGYPRRPFYPCHLPHVWPAAISFTGRATARHNLCSAQGDAA